MINDKKCSFQRNKYATQMRQTFKNSVEILETRSGRTCEERDGQRETEQKFPK